VIADRWADVERFFHEAMQLEPHARDSFLASIESVDVRREVASLLAASGGTSVIGETIDAAAAGALDAQLTGRVLGRFRIIRLLGRGAMGEVYLAADTRLARQVALKLLPIGFLGDSERVRRFEREARSAAALNHPNIVTVHEVGEWEGQPFIAMEFVEGETLAERMYRHPLSTAETIQVALQTSAALEAAHSAGIVHRDLKPANIMVRPDGIVKVLDFGLARLSVTESASDSAATVTRTLPGRILGTPYYMSPEQARGEVVDARSDWWSFGVVLYEILAGQRPFQGSSHMEVLAAILSSEPAPLRSVNRSVPPELADIVSRLLVKEREQRLCSMADVSRNLERLHENPADRKARTKRRRLLAASMVLLLSIVGVSGWRLHRWSKQQWARYEAIPQARALADTGDFAGAYRLALEVSRYIPDDPAVPHLWPDVSQTLSVRSQPAGAEVSWRGYAELKAPWQPLGRTPIDKARVPAGPLRVQVSMPGYETIETAVDRVTSVGLLPTTSFDFTLAPAGSPLARMIRIPAEGAGLNSRSSSRLMDAFDIDRYEVTNREFQEFVNRGGYRNREYWKVPFVKDGRTLSWEDAMAQFVDPTRRPGPSTWDAGAYPPGQDNYPVSGVSWYEAGAYAAFAGKSLPTYAHWMRASNLDVVASDYRFLISVSNLQGGHTQPVGMSGAVNTWGLYDVAGNVREWCWNETSGRYSILGGSSAEQVHDGRAADNAAAFDRSAINGFRCVRYTEPSQAIEKFGGPVRSLERPDYHHMKPVSDEVFALYSRLYAYEKQPLNAKVESVDESSDLWRREKIRFAAPYGNEQEVAYLFLPKQGKPPYQCVVYMGDGGMMRRGSGETIQPEHFVLRSGRAILYPIFKGTLERYVPASNDPVARRDRTIMWRKDFGSSIDYLQTRPDIDGAKLAYMGHSMGTRYSPTMLANEDRIRVAVLFAGGVEAPGALPEGDPVNFLPRVKIPVLLVAGLYDPVYRVDTAQKPMIEMLGTPAANKRHVVLPAGHAILVPEVRNTAVREGLDWLDRYLGRP
jgi:serine/threonine protein kinase/dienelactone hydrolase